MPKTKKTETKKQKLSPAERSQIAKDRWAKRRGTVMPQEEKMVETIVAVDMTTGQEPVIHTEMRPEPPAPQTTSEQPPMTPESSIEDFISKSVDLMNQDEIAQFEAKAQKIMEEAKARIAPAQQPVPAAPKKQKRTPVPKEFSIALKTAESRLAKAVGERAEAMAKLAFLQAEIPSLLQIIAALKGSSNPSPQSQGFMVPSPIGSELAPTYQIPTNPLAVLQNASPQPPISKASGGAIQFGPEVLGGLEGPEEDDDIDKFITGPAAGGGWIGG